MKRQKRSRTAWLVLLLMASMAAARSRAKEEAFEETPAPEFDLAGPSETGDEPEPSPPGSSAFLPGFREKLLEAMGEADAADQSPEQTDRETRGDPWLAAGRAFAWLCVVVALILLASYMLRRLGKRTPFLAGADLGNIVGRLYLAPRTCLHFVRVGERVLVVGVTNNAIAPIAEFDAADFETAPGPEESAETQEPEKSAGGFLEHLWARRARLHEPAPKEVMEDDDLKALREDIRRLQSQLKNVSGALDE